MKSVRAKLVVLVLACLMPAVVGAVLRAGEAEDDLLLHARRRVDAANKGFAAEFDEYQANARLALTLAKHAVRFQQALANHDAAGAQRLVATLAEVYKYRIILAADATGRVLASGNATRAPASLRAEASPAFADLLAGKPLQGLLPIVFADGPGFGMIAAEPVVVDDVQVGEIALVTPLSSNYLDYIGKKFDANLAVKVDEKLAAASTGHPNPELETHGEEALFEWSGGKLFVIKTFRPATLQRPGMRVELTASRDVTELRDAARAGLAHSLLLLGGVFVFCTGIALVFASRIGGAIRAVSSAAAKVKAGTYATVPVEEGGDELATLASNFNAMVRGLEERDRLRDTFGRYVTRQVAEHLMMGKIELGGELLPVTVLFSDIRSFTAISEHMDPKALLDFLNEYFAGMVESVMLHQGVVDKFIGDAIMAVFGAPVPHANDAIQACRAAMDMRERLTVLNEGFRQRGLPEIRAGIGIHSGQVVAGNMGHIERMEYTVIGDPVNLASRLEGMTKELAVDVLLSEDLYLQVADEVDAEPIHKIKVKGRQQEVMVYRLNGVKTRASAVSVLDISKRGAA